MAFLPPVELKLMAPGLICVCILMLAAPVGAQQPGASRVAASPGVGAEAYYQWLSGCLDGIGGDLPAIIRSAEAAAAVYIEDGARIGALGDPALVGEFSGRAGGLGQTSRARNIDRQGWRGVVLFFPRERTLADDLRKARGLRERGLMVIGFGGPAIEEAAREAGVKWSAFIANHAAPTDGLFPAEGGGMVVPTEATASIAATWTWTGEFVAALTRLGKMPVLLQSIMVPGASDRAGKYRNLKFHEGTPEKVEAGRLGREYLAELRRCLGAVHEHEMGKIRKVAEMATANVRSGKGVHVFAHGHALRYLIGVPHDPGLFHQVNSGLFELKDDPGIAEGDLVFCVGYDRIFEGWYYRDGTTRMRAAGATMAWSMTDYNRDPEFGPAALPKDEIIVGQHWELGDAVVTVPGYDIKILPPSGVIALAILRMTEAEMLAILGSE